MLELLLCSMLTILPDYLYQRFVQGKRFSKEITLYSVWFERANTVTRFGRDCSIFGGLPNLQVINRDIQLQNARQKRGAAPHLAPALLATRLEHVPPELTR
jgi:hypothetical protein